MQRNHPVPQRFISISIDGVQNNGRIFYSYTSPIFGITLINSPICDISVDQPTYSLYLLDFPSTMNGWVITGLTPKGDSPALTTEMGPQGLSIMTINPCDPATPTHQYYIHYRNSITGAEIKKDPQEGNVNPPNQTDFK